MEPRGHWFCARGAVVMGDVRLGRDVNIWPGCVLRGDDAPILIGEGTNVQDGTIIHADPGVPVVIGRHVSIGHRAMVHCASVGDYALIGIGAVLLGGATIGTGAIVAAGALVGENVAVPDYAVVMGLPGKVRREVTEPEREFAKMRALYYVEKARRWVAGEYPEPSELHGPPAE